MEIDLLVRSTTLGRNYEHSREVGRVSQGQETSTWRTITEPRRGNRNSEGACWGSEGYEHCGKGIMPHVQDNEPQIAIVERPKSIANKRPGLHMFLA